MVVGLIIRLSPGHLIREMLVSIPSAWKERYLTSIVLQTYPFLQPLASAHHPQLGVRTEAGEDSCWARIQLTTIGKFLSELRGDPDFRLFGDIHLCCRHRVSGPRHIRGPLMYSKSPGLHLVLSRA